MQPINELRFALSDQIQSLEVSPKHIPMALFGEFQKDVGEFVKGSGRDVDLANVLVSIEEGSLALVVSGLLAATTLWSDLEILRSPDALGQIDTRRAAVVERWQMLARKNPHRKYRVADSTALVHLAVDSTSDFRKVEEVWTSVEKYVRGTVLDWGGKSKPNVHLEMDNGEFLIVAATQEMLANEEQNRLYRSALLHISAEQNLLSGKLRHPQLLAFEALPPTYNEAEFQQMVNRGTVAWSGIPAATEWLEELRGGSQ